jgi:pSer/pThr/pTyr-binding forkhead associated (FHA) protein
MNTRIPLAPNGIVIGSDPAQCQIQMKGIEATRQCRIILDGNLSPRIQDLSGAEADVNVNGTNLKALGILNLQAGDKISVGGRTFTLEEVSEAMSFPEAGGSNLPLFVTSISTPKNPDGRDAAQRISLEDLVKSKLSGGFPIIIQYQNPDKPVRNAIFYLDDYNRITIGRDPEHSITLKSKQVSTLHCEILLIDGKLYLRDLASSNGTKLNDGDERINSVEIVGDSTVKAGNQEIQILIPKYEPLVEQAPVKLAEPLPVVNNSVKFKDEAPGTKEFSIQEIDNDGVIGEKHTFYLPDSFPDNKDGLFIDRREGKIVVSDVRTDSSCEILNARGHLCINAGFLSIKINDKKVQGGELINGDRIQIGEHALFKFTKIDSDQLDRPTANAPAKVGHFVLEEPLTGPKDLAAAGPTKAAAVSPDTSGETIYRITLSHKNHKKVFEISQNKSIIFDRQSAKEMFNLEGHDRYLMMFSSRGSFELYINDSGETSLRCVHRDGIKVNDIDLLNGKSVPLNNKTIIKVGKVSGNIYDFTVGVERIDPETPVKNASTPSTFQNPWWKKWPWQWFS